MSIAKDILEKAEKENCKLILPEDLIVAKNMDVTYRLMDGRLEEK